MAKHVDIHFGPTDRTIMGDALDEARRKVVNDYEARTGRKPSENALESIERNIKSQRENEKDLLIDALNVYAAKVKKELDVIVECGQLIARVKKVGDSLDETLELTDHEVRMVKDATPKMENLGYWTLYHELLAQVSSPKYREDLKKITTRKDEYDDS